MSFSVKTHEMSNQSDTGHIVAAWGRMQPIQEQTQPGGISDGAPGEVRKHLEVEEIDWAAEAIGIKIYERSRIICEEIGNY